MKTVQPKPQARSDQSLWAVSSEGMLWQINPINGSAAPVLHLSELTALERRRLKEQATSGWERGCAEYHCSAQAK